MNIYLIGYRGVGKSTVARLLAERLGWRFVDADLELEQRAGKTIREIFAEDGEPAFRDLESDVLESLSREDCLVVGVGGGGVLRESNRDLLCASGKLVWLTASCETILRRISDDPHSVQRRPNLTRSGGPTEVEQLLREREPIYRALADLTVDTETKDPAALAVQIAADLQLA
ncbi:MAG: shikimate kinase [Planctomycetales bacterium]|nr:shikimate kinase [Planctomycetales bacterium]